MEDRVRACIKCKSYIILFPNDPENQKRLKNFEKALGEITKGNFTKKK